MTITLYSKPGCHLCEDVRALLDELAPERGFGIEEINIASDPALFAQYRYEIPVVSIDGTEIGRGRIDERLLIAAITDEGRRTKNKEQRTKDKEQWTKNEGQRTKDPDR